MLLFVRHFKYCERRGGLILRVAPRWRLYATVSKIYNLYFNIVWDTCVFFRPHNTTARRYSKKRKEKKTNSAQYIQTAAAIPACVSVSLRRNTQKKKQKKLPRVNIIINRKHRLSCVHTGEQVLLLTIRVLKFQVTPFSPLDGGCSWNISAGAYEKRIF